MLNDSRPAFFDKIDSDPKSAGDEFCKEALRFMNQCPPRFLRLFHPQEQEDVKQEICLHFIEDNLRVLRQYRPTGKDFGAWFYVSAYNKARDVLRKRNREITIVDSEPVEGDIATPVGSRVSNHPEADDHLRKQLTAVNQLISSMDRYCQLLIRMSGDEFKPTEMARVLRWPKDKAKKISDDLRYCRDKLRKLVSDRGIDVLGAS